MNSIVYENTKYWYKRQLAKNGDTCLATKDPKRYCNGTYAYSSKDPGNGEAFVVIKTESLN